MSLEALPVEWCETAVGNIAEVIAGGTPKAGDPKNFSEAGSGVPWLTPADLSGYNHKYISHGARDLSQAGYDSSSAKLMPAGALLFSSRAPIGYVAVASNPISTNQGFKNFLFYGEVDSSFAYYYLRSIRGLAESLGTGTTFKEISGATAKTLPFVLAPLAEQREIADRLDTLLAQVDTLKGRLDALPAILKRFRQSVLVAAVSGKLTEEWRLQSQAKDWVISTLGAVIKDGPQNGIYKPSKLYGSGTKIIRIDGFYDGEITAWDSIKRVQLDEKEVAKWQLNISDVLINRVNSIEYLGKCGLIRELPEPAVFESNIMRITLDADKALPEYVTLFLSSVTGLGRLRENAKLAVNQASINQGDVKNCIIELPELSEQTEIVRRVEQLFAFADQIEQRVKAAQSRVNHLTQSILAKAFRGELTADWREQHPELISGEHSASALLARIKAERAAQIPAKRPRKQS